MSRKPIPPGHFPGISRIYNKLYKFYGPQGWWPAKNRLEVIVGAILTQNTAWGNVEKAIHNLRKAGLLTSPARISKAKPEALAGLIRPAGYFNVKSTRLKNFIRFLADKYTLSINKMSRRETAVLKDELLRVNGIGPETCDSILLYAFRRPVFVVDAYTKRIFSRHKFFRLDASYEEVQEIFTSNLPVDEKVYNEYHALIVRLGKEFCRSRPKCAKCPLKEIKCLAKAMR